MNGEIVDYVKPIITVSNKQDFIYQGDKQKNFRENVIVMGDILEDTEMVRPSRH